MYILCIIDDVNLVIALGGGKEHILTKILYRINTEGGSVPCFSKYLNVGVNPVVNSTTTIASAAGKAVALTLAVHCRRNLYGKGRFTATRCSSDEKCVGKPAAIYCHADSGLGFAIAD